MGQKILSYEELCAKYPTEEVLVIERDKLNHIKDGVTLCHSLANEVSINLVNNPIFLPRKDVEYNPKYSQPIPYVVIKNGDRYFSAIRIGGDVRLIGKIAIGMGGHINPCDYDNKMPLDTFMNNIHRELSNEELHIDLNKTVSLCLKGIIKYSNPEDIISLDHIGLLYVLDTEDENVRIKETESLKGKFLSREEIISQMEKSENWSKLIIEKIKEGLI